MAIDAGSAAEYAFSKHATDRVPARPGVNYQRVLQASLVTAEKIKVLRRMKDELGHEREVARYRKLSARHREDHSSRLFLNVGASEPVTTSRPPVSTRA